MKKNLLLLPLVLGLLVACGGNVPSASGDSSETPLPGTSTPSTPDPTTSTPATDVDQVTITVATLGISGKGYGETDLSGIDISGVKFGTRQIYAKENGDLIQTRHEEKGALGAVFNETAFPTAVKKITVTYSDKTYNNGTEKANEYTGKLNVFTSKTASVSEAAKPDFTPVVLGDGSKGGAFVASQTYTEIDAVKFVKLEHLLKAEHSYAVYVSSIVIDLF